MINSNFITINLIMIKIVNLNPPQTNHYFLKVIFIIMILIAIIIIIIMVLKILITINLEQMYPKKDFQFETELLQHYLIIITLIMNHYFIIIYFNSMQANVYLNIEATSFDYFLLFDFRLNSYFKKLLPIFIIIIMKN